MFERFTKRARRVVEQAHVHALAATAGDVRPEHLMMALLEDEESLAVRVLASLEVPAGSLRAALDARRAQYVDGLDEEDAEALRLIGIDLDEVVRRIDRNLGGGATRGRKPRFSRGSKKVLELSLREAIALRHNYIGTEHLLLALARIDDRVVADTFAALGVEHDRLRVAVRDALRAAG